MYIQSVHNGLKVKKERLRGARANVPIHRIKHTFNSLTHFLHTASIKFSHGSLPDHILLQPEFEFLFYIVLLSSKILVLFGWDLEAGNSKNLEIAKSSP